MKRKSEPVPEIGNIIPLKLHPEICCEECNEIIHNHVDCPVCKTEYANTRSFGDIEHGEEVLCDECGSIFKHIEGHVYDEENSAWKVVTVGDKQKYKQAKDEEKKNRPKGPFCVPGPNGTFTRIFEIGR